MFSINSSVGFFNSFNKTALVNLSFVHLVNIWSSVTNFSSQTIIQIIQKARSASWSSFLFLYWFNV